MAAVQHFWAAVELGFELWIPPLHIADVCLLGRYCTVDMQPMHVQAVAIVSAFFCLTLAAYMTRMGLWGPGTAFTDFSSFVDAMKKRGVSFMEMLAMVRPHV